ncbi:MAG TPA: hypothetical protein VF390_03130 [Patescibacteria group bacterium]
MREIIQKNQEIKKIKLLDPRLVNYVAQCRKMKIADEEIRMRLRKVGWLESDIERILGKPKIEPNISFLATRAKPIVTDNVNLGKESDENLKEKSVQKKRESKLFSKKTIFSFVTVALALTVVVFVGYYFLFRKDNSSLQSSLGINSGKEATESSCVFEGLSKPDNSGSAAIRVDSTMKLLREAIAKEDYCLALSLYADDSRDKYKNMMNTVIKDENKRNKFLIDLNSYMIPAIDENNPSAEAKATITSNGADGSAAYYIRFSKKESGEYLISSM